MRGLSRSINNEDLQIRLCEILPALYASKMVKVHKALDYAFIHFANRPTAEGALKILQGIITTITITIFFQFL